MRIDLFTTWAEIQAKTGFDMKPLRETLNQNPMLKDQVTVGILGACRESGLNLPLDARWILDTEDGGFRLWAEV